MNPNRSNSAVVIRYGMLDMQVCVPSGWSNEEVKEFADESNPCGTENGWGIRKKGDVALAGSPERNPCKEPTRNGYVHVTLDA